MNDQVERFLSTPVDHPERLDIRDPSPIRRLVHIQSDVPPVYCWRSVPRSPPPRSSESGVYSRPTARRLDPSKSVYPTSDST
jgi:hypothetical protein